MKKFAITLMMLNYFFVHAQKNNDAFYVFKEDWSAAATIDEATYFMQMQQEDDTTFICRYYNKFGPMVKQESFKDADLSIPHGVFAWYDSDGNLDSTGFVFEGKKDGHWSLYDDSVNEVVAIYYDKGKFVSRDNVKARRENEKNDTTNSTEIEVDQIEAKYPSGLKGWAKYLQKNIHTPERLQSIAQAQKKSLYAKVGIQFLVDKEGNVKDVFIYKSFEWSADTEAMRVIKASGKWESAIQDGEKVYYRQRQSITFQVE